MRSVSKAALFVVALGVLGTSAQAQAQSSKRGVGLAAAVGVAVPHGDENFSFDPFVNWGFYVDIPLISTFHITPSTLLYGHKPKGDNTQTQQRTDVSLTFKFVIPLGWLELWAGLTGGITTSDTFAPHVGGEVGASFNLIGNLSVFVNGSYRWVLNGGTEIMGNRSDVRDIHIFAGPMFHFK